MARQSTRHRANGRASPGCKPYIRTHQPAALPDWSQKLKAVQDNKTAARIIGVPALRAKLIAFAVSSFIIGALSLARTLADDEFFPQKTYRADPYAAGGSGFFGGLIDDLNLIDTHDGGVYGVKPTWAEGETQYEVERGVDVYGRLKTHLAVAPWNPRSVGIAFAMIDSIAQDKTPLITINHGRADFTVGRVFPRVFPHP